jgi:hypothetical protein
MSKKTNNLEETFAFYMDFFDLVKDKVLVIIRGHEKSQEPTVGKLIDIRTSYDYDTNWGVFHLKLKGEKDNLALVVFSPYEEDVFVYPNFKMAKKSHFFTIWKKLMETALTEDNLPKVGKALEFILKATLAIDDAEDQIEDKVARYSEVMDHIDEIKEAVKVIKKLLELEEDEDEE